jgi:hypothetical protein
MPFINTNNLPPYGYQVYVAETNWKSTAYTGLEATVTEVQRHRQANSRFGWPTDKASIEQWVLQFTEARLRSMPGSEAWLSAGPSESPPSSFPPRRSPRQRSPASNVVGAVEQVKNTIAGIGLWLEFFGSDGPVKQEQANHRASICARCVKNNREGNPLQRFNEASAKEITAIFGSLKQLKLHTPHDDILGVCDACNCPNKSNVWVPLAIKQKHLREEARAQLDPSCWVLEEEKGLPEPSASL